jgi:hypothetical protein
LICNIIIFEERGDGERRKADREGGRKTCERHTQGHIKNDKGINKTECDTIQYAMSPWW